MNKELSDVDADIVELKNKLQVSIGRHTFWEEYPGGGIPHCVGGKTYHVGGILCHIKGILCSRNTMLEES